MGALDDIEAALRARTGKRVYGTPFYEEKLAELEQAQQGRDIGNQQAAFDLQQKTAMAPLQMEALQAATAGKQASTGKTLAQTEDIEYKNSPEYRQHVMDRDAAILEMKQATNAAGLLAAKKKLEVSDAQIRNLDARAAAAARDPRERPVNFVFKTGEGGETFALNPRDPTAAPIPVGGGGFKQKPSVAEQDIQRQAEQLNDSLATMKKSAEALDLGFAAPLTGRISKAKQSVFPSGDEADFDYAAKRAFNIVYLLSGKAINEQEAKRASTLIPDRARGNLAKQVELYEQYLNSLLSKYRKVNQPSTGSIDPEVDKRLKALGY